MSNEAVWSGPTYSERVSLFIISLTSNVLALALPLALLQVYDRIVPNQSQGTAVVLFSAVLIALLADGFLRYVRFRTLAYIAARFEFLSTERLVERVFQTRLTDLMDLSSGRLRSALTALSQSRDLYTGQGLVPFFDAPFGALFLLLVWYIGGALVLVPVAVLVVLGVAALWSGERQRRSLLAAAAVDQDRTQLVSETFSGLESYKTLGLAGSLFGRFVDIEARRAAADQRTEKLSGFFTDISQIGSQTATIAIALVGSLVVLDGQMTTGGLAACSILGGRGIGSLLALIGGLSRRRAARAADEQVQQLMNLQQVDNADAILSEPVQAVTSGSIGLRFSDAEAARPGADLGRFSCDIEPGAIVAVSLDRRAESEVFLQCATGREELDAGELRLLPGSEAVQQDRLAQITAFVPARPALFAGSILDNLSLFEPNLRPRARELSEEIGLTKIADRLPQGLRTQVGYETVPALSVGAIKRIGIVRALVRDPSLVALQSPGRGLDADGIARLAAMLSDRRGKMTILIATGDQKLLDLATTELTRSDAGQLVLGPRSAS